MFWRFGGYASISAIDAILEKPEFTLEDLLEEQDLIQELKSHNAKLIEYLRDEKTLQKLLEHVIAPKQEPAAEADGQNQDEDDEKGKGKSAATSRPRASSSRTDSTDEDEDDAEKRRSRYSFVAGEVLSSDNWSIYEALMESSNLLRDFWQFLKRPAPLDPLQAGYFTKVNESLFDKKTDEMLDLLKSMPGAVQDMLRHVDSPMIMDLLLKIISLERTEAGQGIVEVRIRAPRASSRDGGLDANTTCFQWLYTQDVIPSLLSFLGPEHSWATQTSAGDFMKAIITVSANASTNEQTCIGPNELTRQLVSKPCVEQLIKYMLGGGNPLTVGVGIVIEVIRKNNSDYDPEVGAEAMLMPTSKDPIYLGTLLRLFAQHVPDFMNLVMNAPAQKQRLNSTFGDKIEPLGFDRFKTCELMAELLHCSNMGLLNEPGSEELIAARDAQRQRLRSAGRLPATRQDEMPLSADDLSMRMSHSSPEETRRLEVTNISDDDGFEEVTHSSGDIGEDTSHEFVKAEEEIAGSAAGTSSSFLDKDDGEFVDEPLSSPRLKAAGEPANDAQFEEPDLVVAPLSPTKKSATLADPAPEEDKQTEQTPAKAEEMAEEVKVEASKSELKIEVPPQESKEETKAERPKSPTVSTPTTESDANTSTTPTDLVPSPIDLPEHSEDVPAPLFSGQATKPSEEVPEACSSEPRPAGDTTEATAETQEADRATNDGELVEGSVVLTKPAEEEASAPDAPNNPVVGDYLKMQFVEYQVVPTILSFFFRYPWNNFLHNVVYDIVQQVFNGPMDRGYNQHLAISLFEAADITTAIINGQIASEESQSRSKTRMGYMGHLTLIAEEVVKFTERHPPELLSETVLERVMSPEWIGYVEGALAETRERDNAILGGVRPEVALANRPGGMGGLGGLGNGGGLSGLGSALGSLSNSGSGALEAAGLNGSVDLSDGSGSGGSNGLGSQYGLGSHASLMSGFGSSSDEEEDEAEENDEDVNSEVRMHIQAGLAGSSLIRRRLCEILETDAETGPDRDMRMDRDLDLELNDMAIPEDEDDTVEQTARGKVRRVALGVLSPPARRVREIKASNADERV